MASPASLATLGSVRPNLSTIFEVSPSPRAVRRIRIIARISFVSVGGVQRWSRAPGRVCRCLVTTDLIEEKGIPFCSESTFRGSRGSREDDADLVLKPPPKPVLKTQPNGPDPVNSALWSPDKVVHDKRLETREEDREKVIESLGEVLEKAEKLETAKSVKLEGKEIRGNGKSSGSSRPSRPVNTSSTTRKSKMLKSVWRKGNPVANVQKVVKEIPRVEKEKGQGHKGRSPVTEANKPEALPLAPLQNQMPSSPQVVPKLQVKPAIAPPAPPTPPVVKKSANLKDRKPILIDRFASKKPIVDPIAAEALLTPAKPVKGPAPSKAKEERRKKSSATGGLRRRLVDDAEIPDEDASELDVPIPGVTEARKGRKWSKASRKAARLNAAKAAAPVKVEILEVGEEGMFTEDLAYKLAVSEADILGYLYSKGIKPDTVHTLDKDMVKMICKEYGVEVLEIDPIRVEEMAKKKEVLDEEDLDMLEDRPPVITIMGHVDHGKVLSSEQYLFLTFGSNRIKSEYLPLL